MKLPELLKFKKADFSAKIFYLFTALLFTAYLFFSTTFIYYQSNALKRDLIHQGELLTELLARTSKLGVFTENTSLLTGPVKSILPHRELRLIQVFTDDGTLLTSSGKNKGAPPGKTNAEKEALEKVRGTGALYFSESGNNITFWAPVHSGTAYTGEDPVYLNRPDEDRLQAVTGPANGQKRIIGYVKTVFTTLPLKEEISGVVWQSLIVPVFFLIPAWIIVFFFVRGMTRPLKVLTEEVTTLGTGMPAGKVPVETNDEIGKLAEAFNHMTDSLEEKEHEKRAVEEQLRQSQKIEAVGTLAGGVAHDFNNILNIIIGYGSLLRKKVTFKESEKKYIDNLIATAEKASKITQSLLSFSRQKRVNLRPEKLNSIVCGMENVITKFIGEQHIELNIMLSESDPAVLTDRGLIEQVLINLISNAKHAMPDGGTLTIRTDQVQVEKEQNVTSGSIEPGSYAVLSIEDTGTGMDTTTREKIFDPFFTTKETGKGTGLGLSMMYGIVQQHSGAIDVNSSPGRGASFSIYLRTTDLLPEPDESSEFPDPLSGTETILLAEDNDELRSLTREVLREYGYNVITASDGVKAVRAFSEHVNDIDLLLLDIIMPGKNGKEVYEAALEKRPDIKVLFISAYTAENINSDDMSPEMAKQRFLQKPFQPARLLRTVRDIIDERS